MRDWMPASTTSAGDTADQHFGRRRTAPSRDAVALARNKRDAAQESPDSVGRGKTQALSATARSGAGAAVFTDALAGAGALLLGMKLPLVRSSVRASS